MRRIYIPASGPVQVSARNGSLTVSPKWQYYIVYSRIRALQDSQLESVFRIGQEVVNAEHFGYQLSDV